MGTIQRREGLYSSFRRKFFTGSFDLVENLSGALGVGASHLEFYPAEDGSERPAINAVDVVVRHEALDAFRFEQRLRQMRLVPELKLRDSYQYIVHLSPVYHAARLNFLSALCASAVHPFI